MQALIIWDKMFGKFVAEDANDRPNYEAYKDFDHYNPFIFIHEYWGIMKILCSPA